MSKPLHIVATFRNLHGIFNPRELLRLSASASTTSNGDAEMEARFGTPFCLDGAQCISGSSGELAAGKFHATVLRDAALNQSGAALL